MAKTFSPQEIRANRIKLLILWLVPFGLMAIAAVVYAMVQFGYISIGSKNHGELIRPPLQLSELAPTTNNSHNSTFPELWDKHWSLVIRGSGSCDQRCVDTLYLTRQLHVRLDKNANRAQRVYLSDAPIAEELQTLLDAEHRYIKVAVASPAQLSALDTVLAKTGPEQASARFFLVDPQGWAMMAYLDHHEGGLILQDLKHLIKYSRER